MWFSIVFACLYITMHVPQSFNRGMYPRRVEPCITWPACKANCTHSTPPPASLPQLCRHPFCIHTPPHCQSIPLFLPRPSVCCRGPFFLFCSSIQNTHGLQRGRNLHAQRVLWSTPLSPRLGSSLLNICTLSPQQPQQTQQAWNPIQAGTSRSHTHLFTTAFGSHLTCSAPVPVHPSSHPRLSVRCSKSSLRLCPSLPPLCSFYPPPSCSVTLSLYRSTVAHAAGTLYLIHYNTSRLTLSQMGGWVSLLLANWSAGCLSSCRAPLLASSLSMLLSSPRWQGILGSAASRR